jgi:hypothetical protein
VRTRRLVVSMEYVHGRHYDTLFAASGVENSPLMDRPFDRRSMDVHREKNLPNEGYPDRLKAADLAQVAG